MLNSLDPDQDRHFVGQIVGPDQVPNCLQRLHVSADDTSRHKVNMKVVATCTDPESFVRGDPTLTTFFLFVFFQVGIQIPL